MKNSIKIVTLLLVSKIVASTDANNFAQPLHSDIHISRVTGQVGYKRDRGDQFSKEEVIALHFLNLMRKSGYPLHKTSVHKFMYFANGLSYAMHDTLKLVNSEFEAHQYGPICDIVQNNFDTRLMDSDYLDIADHLSEVDRKICNYTFSVLRHYTASSLSNFTHEPGTPWSTVRANSFRTHPMKIQQELDRKYFTNTAIMQRFFIEPLLLRSEETDPIILQQLFSSYVTKKIEEFRKNLHGENIEGVKENKDQLLEITKFGVNHSIEISLDIVHTFISSAQTQIEGKLASMLFTEGFIRNGELELFYNPVFCARTAIGGSLKDLSSLYYLGQIFQMFSEEDDDLAAVNAQKANQQLAKLSTSIISIRCGASQPLNWRVSYDRALAYFYLEKHSEAVTEIDLALNDDALPIRYRKDLLRRAFYLTADTKYIDNALLNGLHEFYLQKSIIQTTADEVFSCLEKAIIECDSPEAYFKIGRMILRENYKVSMTSALWSKMQLQHEEANNNQLGIKLIKKAIEFSVSEALTYYIEDSSTDMQEKLEACSLSGDKLWAQYEKGKLFESQHKLQEAFDAYKESGPLIGYMDASRLAPSNLERDNFSRQAQLYKKQKIEELVRYSGF